MVSSRSALFTLAFCLVTIIAPLTMLTGCGPDYRQLRIEGHTAVLNGSYGAGRHFFRQAELKRPRKDADNLHDMGVCSVMLAKQRFEERNYAAAMREVDDAIAYYTAAIDTDPGHQASIEGKNISLELKGQFDEALKQAEWAAEFVGPSAKQHIWLAREHEERGDLEGALLRYRQAVAMEPKNASAHIALADFLLRMDNRDAAVHHLEIANRLDPSNQWVRDKLIASGATDRLVSVSSRNEPSESGQ